jgi:hypothetical protein
MHTWQSFGKVEILKKVYLNLSCRTIVGFRSVQEISNLLTLMVIKIHMITYRGFLNIQRERNIICSDKNCRLRKNWSEVCDDTLISFAKRDFNTEHSFILVTCPLC